MDMNPSRTSYAGFGVAVCFLLSTSIICALFAYSHVSFYPGPDSALCVPMFSIRCEPSDCGNLYVRCGRNQKRQEVPADRVCFRGALIPVASRMHSSGLLPHKCKERTFQARNSTVKFDLKSCPCQQCTGMLECVCWCRASGGQTQRCANSGKTYRNAKQAQCCQKDCKLMTTNGDEKEVSASILFYRIKWNEALDLLHVLFSSSLRKVCDFTRKRFTFPLTLEVESCCSPPKVDYCSIAFQFGRCRSSAGFTWRKLQEELSYHGKALQLLCAAPQP
ncbi:hypothetical protein R1flu_023812 [Riccia fluitans]|uniref:Uncharacterized protein n=1 Tax=Riccia fluitans TaxID=41844 RepID=A0ABD1XT44_9MARC